MLSKRSFVLSAAIVSLVAGSFANAAVVVTKTSDVAPGGNPGDTYTPSIFSASSTDLLQGKSATITYPVGSGSDTTESSGGAAKWTDGSISTIYALSPNDGANQVANHAAYGIINAAPNAVTTSVVYDLGASYNLSSANVYQGWNDSGRDSFSFTLGASTDGINFSPIGSFDKGAIDDTGTFTTPVTSQINFADDVGASIASGVRYLQILSSDSDNGYAGMSEFDVFGTPVSTPEPASLSLIGVTGLMLLRRRR